MTVEHSIPPEPTRGDASPSTLAYAGIREGAVAFDRSREGRLRLTGADVASWLQGLLTNDIAALAPGHGCYAAYLTPQGRMISDVRVLALADAWLLDLPAGTATRVRERFELFVITEEVAIEDVSAALARIAVHGPAAAAVAARAVVAILASGGAASSAQSPTVESLAARFGGLGEHESVQVAGALAGETRPPVSFLLVAGARELGVQGFDIYLESRRAEELLAHLVEAGAVVGDATTWDLRRLEAGTPVFGLDMDEDTIPLEAGIQDRAISFTKGCYVGQEVIVRVMHRGHGRVARRLVGLTPSGPSPSGSSAAVRRGDALISADGDARDLGRVTSAAYSPALARTIALGYVHRDFAEVGTTVLARHDDEIVTLQVTPLPFVTSAPGVPRG